MKCTANHEAANQIQLDKSGGYYSGLADLINHLAKLADDKIKALPAKDLAYLQSCVETAQISLNGIAFAAALTFQCMEKDERDQNGLIERNTDFALTNAETNELFFKLSHEWQFIANNPQIYRAKSA
ncbi:hypothetical protein ACKLNO_11155 [Neisseriaceae bacterium B1]